MEKSKSDQPKYDRQFTRVDKVRDILDAKKRKTIGFKMSGYRLCCGS